MRTLVAAAVACLTAIGLSQAGETEASIKKPVSIPAQDLGTALQSFAQERQLYLIYASQDVTTLQSKGATGELTQDEALRTLLNGTGLTFRYIDDKTVSILPLATAPPASQSRLSVSGEGREPTRLASSFSSELPVAGDEPKGLWQKLRLAQAESSAQQPATTSEAEESVKLEEIVVTGLKRKSQVLSDVPSSVSVITGDKVESYGAESVTDFLQFTPGLSLDRLGTTGAVQIQIRGASSRNGSGTVGYYMDGLPFSFINLNWLPDPSPFDLDRVEVLRGPQGTLYGAGSSAGVVLIKSNDPNFDGFGGKLDLNGSTIKGGGDSYSVSGALNVPLVEDKVALRGAISYQDNAGWIDDLFVGSLKNLNDETRATGRLKLLAKPTDNLSISLLAVSSRIDREVFSDLSDDADKIAASTLTYPIDSEIDYDQYGAVVEYRFPKVTLVNSFGYIDYHSNTTVPLGPGLPIPVVYDTRAYTNELRLSSDTSGPLSWVVGGFFKDASQFLFNDASFIGLPFNADDNSDSEQYSVFADAVLALWDGKLDLGAGGSYFEGDSRNVGNLVPAVPAPVISKVDTEIFSPQVTLAYHPTSSSTLYARYAKGFRPGVIDFSLSTFIAQFSIPGITGIVSAEKLDSYEVGIKGNLLDGRLYAEVALFLNETTDTQQTTTVVDPVTGVGANTIGNVGDTQARGVEFTVDASIADGLDLRFAGSYTDAEVVNDVFAQGENPATSVPLFAEGDPLYLIPKWVLSSNISYSWALTSLGLKATASANTQYTSERPLPNLRARPTYGEDILRADVRLEVGKDNWSIYAFALNINNDRDPITLAPNLALGANVATRLQPRTLGLGFRSSF